MYMYYAAVYEQREKYPTQNTQDESTVTEYKGQRDNRCIAILRTHTIMIIATH